MIKMRIAIFIVFCYSILGCASVYRNDTIEIVERYGSEEIPSVISIETKLQSYLISKEIRGTVEYEKICHKKRYESFRQMDVDEGKFRRGTLTNNIVVSTTLLGSGLAMSLMGYEVLDYLGAGLLVGGLGSAGWLAWSTLDAADIEGEPYDISIFTGHTSSEYECGAGPQVEYEARVESVTNVGYERLQTGKRPHASSTLSQCITDEEHFLCPLNCKEIAYTDINHVILYIDHTPNEIDSLKVIEQCLAKEISDATSRSDIAKYVKVRNRLAELNYRSLSNSLDLDFARDSILSWQINDLKSNEDFLILIRYLEENNVEFSAEELAERLACMVEDENTISGAEFFRACSNYKIPCTERGFKVAEVKMIDKCQEYEDYVEALDLCSDKCSKATTKGLEKVIHEYIKIAVKDAGSDYNLLLGLYAYVCKERYCPPDSEKLFEKTITKLVKAEEKKRKKEEKERKKKAKKEAKRLKLEREKRAKEERSRTYSYEGAESLGGCGLTVKSYVSGCAEICNTSSNSYYVDWATFWGEYEAKWNDFVPANDCISRCGSNLKGAVLYSCYQ